MVEATPQDIIRWYNSQGIKDAALASNTGLSPATISNIKHGKPLSQKSTQQFYKLVDGYTQQTGEDVSLNLPNKRTSTSTTPKQSSSRKEGIEEYSSSTSLGGVILNILVYGGVLLFSILKYKTEMKGTNQNAS